MTTTDHAAVEQRVASMSCWPRLGLLALLAADVALLAVRLARYPSFFANPGAFGYVVAPVAALLVYALAMVLLPFAVARAPGAGIALRVGAVVGLAGGAIEVVDIALESLWTLPQPVVSVSTGIGMLALFASFGVAGFLGSRRTRAFGLGIAAALASAVVAIFIAVTCGFVLVNVALPQLARNEVGDPDFVRSGWTDMRAFAIANTFDSGFIHLVEAPLIAAVLGAVGSGIGQLGKRGWRDRA